MPGFGTLQLLSPSPGKFTQLSACYGKGSFASKANGMVFTLFEWQSRERAEF